MIGAINLSQRLLNFFYASEWDSVHRCLFSQIILIKSIFLINKKFFRIQLQAGMNAGFCTKNMDELCKEFLIESHENLDRLERDLIALEKYPRDKVTLDSIFRTIHTLKGSSGFLAFSKLEGIAHAGENLLSKMRDGVLLINQEIAGALLNTSDAVREVLGQIESTGCCGERDYSALIQRLYELNEAELNEAELKEDELKEDEAGWAHDVGGDGFAGLYRESGLTLESEAPLPVQSTPSDAPPLNVSPVVSGAETALVSEVQAGILNLMDNKSALSPDSDSGNNTGAPLTSILAGSAAVEVQESRGSAASDSSIRVDVSLLDKLVNLVGELVLARNQILQFTSQHTDTAFLGTAQRLNLITTELQGSAMKTRMQPIGNLWSKLPRIVRDLASGCGKVVRLEMEGKDTELDKTIIEAIKDPLTHIVRNSVDHGIETPDARVKRGKPREGCLKMRAYHEGGQVNIEIADDGGGIDLARIKEKAVQRGLLKAEYAAVMGEHEALQLIFMPGFSTAEKVTNVSGRGVGMDVVKTNIEKIGGTVDLQSQLGRGTVLKIKIPLTLAIIPALVVTSGGERFAIPQVSLLELVRLEGTDPAQQIEHIHGAPVYRLRGKLLPLLYLNAELKLGPAAANAGGMAQNEVNIVVLQTDGHPFGLVLDEINDTQEIVVKPLGKQLKGVACFAGATIMGDGRVALILDVLGLAQQAKIVGELHERTNLMESSADSRGSEGKRQTLLLFTSGPGTKMAIPLSMVARLEEFSRSSIEYSGGNPVVRYRGQILPLVQVSEHLHPRNGVVEELPDSMQVVVYSEKGRSVGLVVGCIDDIVNEVIEVKRHAFGNGILGSVVIQDCVTDLLDVLALIRDADPSFATSKSTSTEAA